MIQAQFQEAFSDFWQKTHVPNACNELVILRKVIPWQKIITQLLQFYCADKGKIGTSLRIMVALLILGNVRQLSDRQVVQQVKENAYGQYFCNVPPEQLRTFISETSPLSRFRQRIGIKGIQIIEDTLFEHLRWAGIIDSEMCLMDSTVLESSIIYPNDVQLVFKGAKKIWYALHKAKIQAQWNHDELKKRWRAFNRDKSRDISEYLFEFTQYFEQSLSQYNQYFEPDPLLPC